MGLRVFDHVGDDPLTMRVTFQRGLEFRNFSKELSADFFLQLCVGAVLYLLLTDFALPRFRENEVNFIVEVAAAQGFPFSGIKPDSASD